MLRLKINNNWKLVNENYGVFVCYLLGCMILFKDCFYENKYIDKVVDE